MSDHRIDALFRKSRMRPNLMPFECMHGHRARCVWISSGSVLNPCFVVTSCAENNMPTATCPNASDLFTAVDFPADVILAFRFFRTTFVTITSCSLNVAGPSPSFVGNKCPRHEEQCFSRLFICAMHFVRRALHARYRASTSIDHGTSRPGITRTPSRVQNFRYSVHSRL